MHRHVRRVGDKASLAVEQGAGEVEPLLDVDRIGGVLQRHAHLLGDRHEEMVEDLEHDRVGLGADRLAPRHGLDAGHQHMVFRRDRRAPALFDDDRLMRLDDERRPVDFGADGKRLAQKDIRLAPAPMRKEARRAGGSAAATAGAADAVSDRVYRLRSASRAAPPTASADTASMAIALSRSMKPKRLLCALSNARRIAAGVDSGTSIVVSEPE